MKNFEKRYRFSEKCSNLYKKCEKVIKFKEILKNYMKNSEKNFHQDYLSFILNMRTI